MVQISFNINLRYTNTQGDSALSLKQFSPAVFYGRNHYFVMTILLLEGPI